MVLESIVVIFGLFSAITGVLFYFIVPLLFFQRFPKIKAEHVNVDVMREGDQELDPVIVGVASFMHPSLSVDLVRRVRAASIRLFKPEMVVQMK